MIARVIYILVKQNVLVDVWPKHTHRKLWKGIQICKVLYKINKILILKLIFETLNNFFDCN